MERGSHSSAGGGDDEVEVEEVERDGAVGEEDEVMVGTACRPAARVTSSPSMQTQLSVRCAAPKSMQSEGNEWARDGDDGAQQDPLLTPRNQAQAAILAAPRHLLTQISRGIGGIRGCSWLGPCICPNHPSPSFTVTRPNPLLSQTVTLHNPNPLSITRSGLLLGSTLILLK